MTLLDRVFDVLVNEWPPNVHPGHCLHFRQDRVPLVQTRMCLAVTGDLPKFSINRTSSGGLRFGLGLRQRESTQSVCI